MLLNVRKLFKDHNLSFAGVIHVGGNVGEERKLYRELGIYRQIWIEANPFLHETLLKNVSNVPQVTATVIRGAMGAEDLGTATLHLADNGGQSSSLLQPKLHLQKHPDVGFDKSIIVDVSTLDTTLHFLDIDPTDYLLVIDVQGVELDVLKGAAYNLPKYKALIIELNQEELYTGCALVGEIDAYLEERGFVRVATKWTDRGWGEGLYLKK